MASVARSTISSFKAISIRTFCRSVISCGTPLNLSTSAPSQVDFVGGGTIWNYSWDADPNAGVDIGAWQLTATVTQTDLCVRSTSIKVDVSDP